MRGAAPASTGRVRAATNVLLLQRFARVPAGRGKQSVGGTAQVGKPGNEATERGTTRRAKRGRHGPGEAQVQRAAGTGPRKLWTAKGIARKAATAYEIPEQNLQRGQHR